MRRATLARMMTKTSDTRTLVETDRDRDASINRDLWSYSDGESTTDNPDSLFGPAVHPDLDVEKVAVRGDPVWWYSDERVWRGYGFELEADSAWVDVPKHFVQY